MRAIYAHAVTEGTGTFEIDAPDDAELVRRRDEVVAKGLPWLVAESGGEVLGYAYATPSRPRPAYRFCVEDSIYLRPGAQGRGVGRVLLAELVARCEAAGCATDAGGHRRQREPWIDRRAPRARFRALRRCSKPSAGSSTVGSTWC